MKRKPSPDKDNYHQPRRRNETEQDALNTRESFLRSLFHPPQRQQLSPQDFRYDQQHRPSSEGQLSPTGGRNFYDLDVPAVPQGHLAAEPVMVPVNSIQQQTQQQHQNQQHDHHQLSNQSSSSYSSDAYNPIPYFPQHQYFQNNSMPQQQQTMPQQQQPMPQNHGMSNQQVIMSQHQQQEIQQAPYHMYPASGGMDQNQGFEIVTPSPLTYARSRTNRGAVLDSPSRRGFFFSRGRQELEVEPKKQVVENPEILCNCVKSRCLKLYCDCFQAGTLCNTFCNCKKCLNVESEASEGGALFRAKGQYMARKPGVFGKKKKKVSEGCSCRNNRCLKKYCYCFRNEIACNPEKCSCLDCANVSTCAGAKKTP